MNKNMEWINHQARLGKILIAAGLIIGIFGIVLPRLVSGLQFNTRIITGLGILVLGIGVANLMRYSAPGRDAQAARRLVSEERDERMLFIRARAGNRAYWFSAVMMYAGLMWVSFVEGGSLPPLSPDALWYYLAAGVILPFIVYAISLKVDQDHF